MLTNKKTLNARLVKAIPTRSGNGFTKDKEYTFTHEINGLYVTYNDNGHERYEDFDDISAHLWDGINDQDMGRFVITEINND